MKTKQFLFAALAAIALAGCTSDDILIADTPPADNNDGMMPILFTSSQKAFTRADYEGAKAAELLGNKFVVFGYKGGQTLWKTDYTGDDVVKNNSKVFDNYLVEYAENTANTTESNSDNWEYVGKGVIKHAADNGITQQTIKYWDYSKTQYDFFAWSTGSTTTPSYDGTYTTGTVAVSAMAATAATGSATGLVDAYTFAGTATDLKECYISDLVTVYKGTVTGSGTKYGVVENGYQQPVKLKFRQLGTKVRIGLYETIPGYSVKNVEFYSAANSDDASATAAKIFTTVPNDIYEEGTYTVYFPTVDDPTKADNNQAHIDFAPKSGADQKTTVDWGALNYTIRESGESSTDAIYLGRTSNTASFAGVPANNYYVVYLPNKNGTNLNLRVNYTLESIDGSQETIVVKGATAQVPLIYTQWKPGYAYTYLFKISDKTNGYTGEYNPLYPDDTTVNSDPAGLYPITFDAVVVNAEEDKVQETITTVSTPSITTYQKGSNVVNQNEYKSGSDYPIFVTVNDGNTSYEQVTGLTAGSSSVAGYYTKGTEDVYTPASGTANASTTYYTYDEGTDTYSEAASQPSAGDDISSSNFYTKSTKDVYIPASGTAVASTDYFRMVTTVESGKLVTLTTTGSDKAALYTLPDDKVYTEADVVDAMQMQDDDAATNTVKGRSGLVLTEATSASPTLKNSIEYGVDGNAIDLTKLPEPTGSGTYSANAMRFIPAAGTNYAFVYTKTASTTTKDEYEPRAFSGTGTKYRYETTAVATPGDVEKDVVYVKPTTGTYSLAIKPVFLGQGTGNLFIPDGSNYTPVNTTTSPYVVSSPTTTYYYTLDNGTSYKAAKNIAYANFNATGDNQLYVKSGAYYEPKPTTETEPVDGTAYYFRTGDSEPYTYTYCVILPEQTETSWYTVDTSSYEDNGSNVEIEGMTYFDKYTKNNGVYYTKVIKVQ